MGSIWNRWRRERPMFRQANRLVIIAAAIFIGMLIYLAAVPNVSVISPRADSQMLQLTPVSRQEVPDAEAPLGVRVEYRLRMEDSLPHGGHLVFYVTHQYASVYKGNVLLYSLRYPQQNRFARTVGVGWVQVPLYESDIGQELRVVLTPVYEPFLEEEPEFLVGSRLNVLRRQVLRELPQVLLASLTVLAGIIYQAVAIYLSIKRRTYERISMLGIFSVLVGGWKLADCLLAAFVFPEKSALLHYYSLASLFLAAIPLVRFMRPSMQRVRWMDGYVVAYSAMILLLQMLQLTGLMDLRQTLFITHGMIFVGVAVVSLSMYRDRKYIARHPSDKRSMVMLLICSLGAAADVAAFYLMGTSTELMFSLLAFLLYVTVAGIYSIQDYLIKEKQLREQEKELVERRMSLLMSQIQPHFIYNTLGTIRYLCRTDPEQAAWIVQEFSLYLRGNFGELNNPTPIRISRELEHVRHYVAIEKTRFPDMEITYDLRADEFFLPALSVQPLVENAIKHGLMKLEYGGRVEIATYETEICYCVKITDNGAGFDTNKVIDPAKHIGIQNIRGRLQAMCGGSLTIESTPGQGTTALIRIPKEASV